MADDVLTQTGDSYSSDALGALDQARGQVDVQNDPLSALGASSASSDTLSGLTSTPAVGPSAPVVGSNPSTLRALGDNAGAAGANPGAPPPPHRTLNTVLRYVALGLAGAAAGGGEKRPGEAAAAGVKTGIGLVQQGKENARAQAESESKIHFQNVQAAEATARAAMYDKQLHNMDTQFQDEHNARTLTQMKELQAMGITPTIVADNHGQGANAALEQLTASHGGVPHMFILNLGDKLVGYDMAQLGGMSAMRDQVNAIQKIMGKGDQAYSAAAWGMLSPEAKNSLLQSSLGFFNPMPTKEGIDNQLQQYKNWRDAYAMNPTVDKAMLGKLDDTIKMLGDSRDTFIKQKGDEAAALTTAETPAKVAQATAVANAELPIKAAAAAAETTARLGAEQASSDIENTAMRLVEGFEDPTQMSKRSRTYDAQLGAADKYSMAKYGKHFDMAKAQSDYKYSTNASTQNTLKYLNSLTGNPVTGTKGNLDLLIEKSNAVTRTDFPALNDAAAWARAQTGDPKIAELHTVAVDAADQFAKIMSSGGSGNATSDAKIKQGIEMFNTGFSKKVLQDVANTANQMLSNRKRELIGDNRYLQKDYGTHAGLAPGMIRIKASDGGVHDIPAVNLEGAKQIDPKLSVL